VIDRERKANGARQRVRLLTGEAYVV
jgi:hypothetical protein